MKKNTLVFLFVFLYPLSFPRTVSAAPAISSITAPSSVQKYEKYEITFQVNTTSTFPQFPYDTAAPAGIDAGTGITVNAQFSPNNWATNYTQPAFYYQDFDDNGSLPKSGKDWLYPTNNYSWKVRFAPNQEGNWKYRLTAQDATGSTQSSEGSFSVTASPSNNHGFIKVSPNDSRYFIHDDGTYFPALGYNMNYRQVDWVNPIQANKNNFQIMGQNGIQFIRIWLSQWAIFGSSWNSWRNYWAGGYFPDASLTYTQHYPGSELSMFNDAAKHELNRCMFISDWESTVPAVKRNTTYKVKVRYKTTNLSSSNVIVSGQPYGFVIKTGGWLWDDSDQSKRCYYPGTGTAISSFQPNNVDWTIMEGSFNSGSSDFMPNLFLVLANLSKGESFIDYVWVQEDLGGGNFGPNILPEPWMDHHRYFDQRNSFAFDKVLDLAHQNGIYLRPVMLEKEDWVWDHIAWDGSWTATSSHDNAYGNWRTVTKTRWLFQAWWRYAQARWGYSPNIHSWELFNEGDPGNGNHWAGTDEMGKYLRCRVFGQSIGTGDGQKCTYDHPNDHLVSTSFWSGFPTSGFWGNANYPNVDFADVHTYWSSGQSYSLNVDGSGVTVMNSSDYNDTAALTNRISMLIGAKQQYGPRKPVVRGESGWNGGNFTGDSGGVWLHKFIWAGINPGGFIDSGDWYPNFYIYSGSRDLRPKYGNYYRFIKDVPLGNGRYVDAAAQVSNANIWVLGQKDLTNGRAHLWINNKNHTWTSLSATAQSGTVTVAGFTPNQSYRVEWWDTSSGAVSSTQTLTANSQGNIVLSVSGLTTDTAVRIGDYSATVTPIPTVSPVPTATPSSCSGDLNNDRVVNLSDLSIVLTNWGKTGSGDTNSDGIVNLSDIAYILSRWGNCP